MDVITCAEYVDRFGYKEDRYFKLIKIDEYYFWQMIDRVEIDKITCFLNRPLCFKDEVRPKFHLFVEGDL